MIGTLILGSPPAVALVFIPDYYEVTCPYDGTKIEVTRLKPGIKSGATFDFQLVGDIVSPPPLVSCPDGFTFFKEVMTPAEFDALRPFVISDEFRAMQQESVHYRAAWLAEKLDRPATEIVEHLLHATWVAPSAEAYSRYATALLERLPRAKAIQTDDQEWMRLRLVQGEILRRLGRLDAAREHFERLRAERGDGAIEGVLAKLQLELIEKGDTERHVVPADVLERARSTSAWLKDRRPLLANGSRFEIIGQLPTKGRDSFQWDSTSRNIFVRDATAGASGITTHSIADGSISLTRALPYSIIDLLAALPTGNLLMLVQPSGLADDQARLIELDPKTSREVVSRLAGRRYARPGLVSFDRRFVLLGAEPDSLTAFATKGRTLERLPGPSERTFPLAMDQFGPRVILVDQRLNEGVIVWNYEQAREEFRFMFDQEERRFLPNILNAAVDVRRNALHVLWWTRHAGCKLATVELSTGRVLREQEEPGGRPLASLSLSGDGRYLAYECGPKVRVIDLASSKSVLETMTPPGDFEFNNVKFSPDSRYLAVDINSVASVLAVRP